MICHHCGVELKFEGYIARSDECPRCSSDVHCCLNCYNYDPHAHNKCREPQAEWVTDREKANFCDFLCQQSETCEYFQESRRRCAFCLR